MKISENSENELLGGNMKLDEKLKDYLLMLGEDRTDFPTDYLALHEYQLNRGNKCKIGDFRYDKELSKRWIRPYTYIVCFWGDVWFG